jgi:hypothetical protein
LEGEDGFGDVGGAVGQARMRVRMRQVVRVAKPRSPGPRRVLWAWLAVFAWGEGVGWAVLVAFAAVGGAHAWVDADVAGVGE